MNDTVIKDDTTLDDAVPRQTKYLAKEDCDPDVLVTIAGMTLDDIERDDGKNDRRAILHFHGDLKPLVLNQTNKELLKEITGATTVGGVKNKKVVLYNDATIIFKGKMVGGIRLRAAKNQPQEDDDSEIPF